MHKQLNLKKTLITKGTTLAPGASAGEDSKVGFVMVAPLSPLSARSVLRGKKQVQL